jgi:hypothetical protein
MLKDEQKEWVESAIAKGFTRLQAKKKLKDTGFNEKEIDDFLDYYDSIKKVVEEVVDPVEEEEFKKDVKQYFEDKSGLSFWKKREVKSWLKKMNKLNKVLKDTIRGLKLELKTIKSKTIKEIDNVDKEIVDLKKETIDRMLELRSILIIEDPNTGEEITKESLQSCEMEQLIEMLEENRKVLELTVNGKIE